MDQAGQLQGYGARAAPEVEGVLGAVQAEPVGEEPVQRVGVPGAEAGVVGFGGDEGVRISHQGA